MTEDAGRRTDGGEEGRSGSGGGSGTMATETLMRV